MDDKNEPNTDDPAQDDFREVVDEKGMGGQSTGKNGHKEENKGKGR